MCSGTKSSDWLKYFEHFPIKHNIFIDGDIAGIIWGIRNNLIPDDCCFPHEEIAELVCQEVSRGKMGKIYIWVTSLQVSS